MNYHNGLQHGTKIKPKTNNLILHLEQRFYTIYHSTFCQEHKHDFITEYISIIENIGKYYNYVID